MTVVQITGAGELAQQPAWSEEASSVDGTAEIVSLYRLALRRLIGRRNFGRFEVLLLWNVSNAVATLSRHGIGDSSPSVTLAARYALEQIEIRGESEQPFRVLADEGMALDDLLRVHEQQLGSDRLAAILLTGAVGERGQRGMHRQRGAGSRRTHASAKAQCGTALYG